MTSDTLFTAFAHGVTEGRNNPCKQVEVLNPYPDSKVRQRIEPSQARYRMAHALQRLANALNVQLLPTDEDCVCLERLASQAEFLKAITHDFESPASREVILETDLEERVAEELADERSREDFDNR